MFPADLPIVDAHHHLAKLELGYPWLAADAPIDRYHGDDRSLRRDYLVDDYLADFEELPLAGSVHIENGARDPLAEARWIGDIIAERSPTPAVHVARVDLSAADASAMLEEYSAMPHVRGVRHILNWHPDPRYTHTPRPGIIDEPFWRSNFARLAQLDLSFDLQVFADQLDAATDLARTHPGTSIVLDHAGMPISREREYLEMWSRALRRLAECENVTAKISAIGTTDHRWTTDSLRPIVRRTIDAFGPERIMFGSNFPVDGMYSALAVLYRAFDRLTADCTTVERRAMFAGNAERVYRVDSGAA